MILTEFDFDGYLAPLGNAQRIKKTAQTITDFAQISGNLLIHKSEKDLWKISEDGGYIERLYDEAGSPLSMEGFNV